MALLVLFEIIAKWWIQLHQFSDYLSGYAGTLEWTDHFSASLSHLTSPTLMPSFDVQHLTDFDKMRYYCANMQTFAAHYTTQGNWPKLFTALIRVIFQINIHFTHLLGKRCWNCTILLWQKPFWSVIWKWQGRHFRKSSKLRTSLFVTSRWPRSSGQTNYQVHHPPWLWSIDSCQNREFADQYHLRASRAQVSTHRSQVFFKVIRWKCTSF